MNIHSYILVFYKGEELEKENRPVRYRRRLIEKLQKTSKMVQETLTLNTAKFD
jgi:hypothetical protein